MIFTNINGQAARDPDEEGDYLAFEQLMAEAATKKSKDDKKKKKESKTSKSPDRVEEHQTSTT